MPTGSRCCLHVSGPGLLSTAAFSFLCSCASALACHFQSVNTHKARESKDIDDLLDGLSKLVTDGIAAIPDDTSVEILERKGGGEPVQAQLIDLCNREMSKGTDQPKRWPLNRMARARVQPVKPTPNALAKTERADRALVSDGRNQILQILHEINFNGGEPPLFMFKDKRDVNLEAVNRVPRNRPFGAGQ